MSLKERDPYLSAAGSFFFPGLGQVYCGRILRGIVFLIPGMLVTTPNFIFSALQFWFNIRGLEMWPYYDLYSVLYKMIDFIVRVIATYDAYRIAKSVEDAQAQ